MRLFIAIDFNEETKSALFETATELMRQANAGRIVPLDNFHLTLVFLGETERLQQVQEAMTVACRAALTAPLQVRLRGIGSFPGHKGKGHTWWVGVEDNPALTTLVATLTEELRAAGFALEKRSYKPHITLARAVHTSRPITLNHPEIDFTTSTISLMRSTLKTPHPLYRELSTYHL
ncbi:MAG: RNA 2',3'-cyclic phosphodiesterase [Coriobacteriia bacterium]|nr:RNA 2',3'-cyclic phosphodiesterase [Coriobacteriia bacterium]